MVRNPLAMQETWVQSLGWEDPLEKRTATHSSILAWWATVHGVAKRLNNFYCSLCGFIRSKNVPHLEDVDSVGDKTGLGIREYIGNLCTFLLILL